MAEIRPGAVPRSFLSYTPGRPGTTVDERPPARVGDVDLHRGGVGLLQVLERSLGQTTGCGRVSAGQRAQNAAKSWIAVPGGTWVLPGGFWLRTVPKPKTDTCRPLLCASAWAASACWPV